MLDNFAQWLVANTLYLEMIQLLNQKDGVKEIWGLDLYWKSRPVFSTSNMELKFEFGPWIKTILILGSEFPTERSNTWSILFKTTQKFLQIHKKSKFHKQAQAWLQPGQRQKQNLNREFSLVQQQPYQYTKEDGLTLSHQNKNLASYDLSKKVINPLRHNQTLQREEDGAIEFCKIKFHFRNHHSQIQNWSDDRWKACLAARGGSKRRYQNCSDNLEQFSTSVLFKDILEPILLILCYRTMWWLELEYSLTFTTSDAHSMFILLSTMDWYLEVKIWAEDKRSSCLLIQEMKITETLNILTSVYHVSARYMHSAWKRHQDAVFWVDYWSCDQRRINILSNKIECNYSSRNTSSPLYFKSWKIENWRNVVWKTIFVSSTTTKDLIETRSQLD